VTLSDADSVAVGSNHPSSWTFPPTCERRRGASAANADSALMALGVSASPLGPRLITNGDITNVTINDSTILLPEPDPFLLLIAGAVLLWVFAVRRESFSKPARC